MRFLLFTLEYPPFYGGVSSYYINLVKNWPQEKSELNISNNNQNEIINPKAFFLKWKKGIFTLNKEIKKEKIDYILVGHILPLGTIVWILSHFLKIKYAVILHGMDFASAIKSKRKKILTHLILNKTHKIICANHFTADLVIKFSPQLKNKITVVNPGVAQIENNNLKLTHQLKELYKLKNKIILLSVGRLVSRKGFDMVLKSLPKTLEVVPNLIYIILGSGPEEKKLRQNIIDFNLEDKVILISKANEEEKIAWLSLSDIFIMPSRQIGNDFEGFGIVYLEANLFGKPVIAGRSGGVEDAVKDELNGLLVDPESEKEISLAIIKLTQDKNLRIRLGKQGRERALNEFNWKNKIKEFYNKLDNN